MYKVSNPHNTHINRNTTYEGETIETKVRRIVNNKEPISDGAPLVYTERKEGVKAEYNIKTDRFEVAIDAMDKVAKAQAAKRDGKPTLAEEAKEGMKKEGEGESKA
jgi:CRISPR/Cas system-associated protein Cas7 (RAMP superfamily)